MVNVINPFESNGVARVQFDVLTEAPRNKCVIGTATNPRTGETYAFIIPRRQKRANRS